MVVTPSPSAQHTEPSLMPEILRPVINGAPDGVWDFAGQDTQYSTHALITCNLAFKPLEEGGQY